MSAPTPQQWRDRALAAEQSGDRAAALTIIEEAIAAHRDEAPLLNTAGNLAMRASKQGQAADYFSRAAELEPDNLEFGLNHAIALSAVKQHEEALRVLDRHCEQGSKDARYCSARGAAERGAGNLAQASEWYDAAIALNPSHARALHGRARVAIERGESDARQRFDRALAVNNGDVDLWLGRAQSLDVEGDTEGAREIAEALVQQAPQWTEGLRFLAQLRLAEGESDFTAHYEEAARKLPQDPNILSEWISVLAGLDHGQQAADVAADARKAFPAITHFGLLEAINAGVAGDDDRAERVFATLTLDTFDRHLHETRHRIRRGEFDHAAALLEKVLQYDPWSISGWALRGILWRLTGDERSAWLHEQAGLVDLLPLVDGDSVLGAAVPFLHELHDKSSLPLGQSLRGGSQTRGILFARMEEPLAALRRAIEATIAHYCKQLPSEDNSHPLLRHRNNDWRLAGSWSVRLSGGGDFHTAHIHPQGIVSSALYCETPDGTDGDGKEGWLEVGRPPPDLRLDLPPLRTIEPKPGYLALFPSTMYHGTRPFPAGQRMTVAFDVTTDQNESR